MKQKRDTGRYQIANFPARCNSLSWRSPCCRSANGAARPPDPKSTNRCLSRVPSQPIKTCTLVRSHQRYGLQIINRHVLIDFGLRGQSDGYWCVFCFFWETAKVIDYYLKSTTMCCVSALVSPCANGCIRAVTLQAIVASNLDQLLFFMPILRKCHVIGHTQIQHHLIPSLMLVLVKNCTRVYRQVWPEKKLRLKWGRLNES